MNPKQIVFTLAVTAVGLVLGGLWGTQQDAGYETRHVVMLEQVMRTRSFEAGPRTAAFSAALLQESSRERAAEATGLDPSDFEGIFAKRVDSSSIMEVDAVTSVREGAADRISGLIEATLLELIDQERSIEQLVVDGAASELADLEATLDDIYQTAGVARGSDLADQLEGDRFNLTSSIGQLENLPESDTYWVVRLPGDIEAYEARIAAITPVLDSWQEASERLDELDDTAGDAERRLTELESAEAIAREGTAVLEGTTVARSTRIAAGRWTAIGGVVGLAVALTYVGVSAVMAGRRSAVGRPAAEGSSAATAS
jgi:hypothetical protein